MFKKDGGRMSEKREILKRAIDTFGYPSQMHMVIEEMSELTKEICKVFRGDGEVDHLAEEIADVRITIEQLCIMFDLHNLVEEYESHKLERLEKRLDEWGKGNE
jgi:NTP pyrophosphatase (non-canonical NTP hydrolase)